MEHINKIILWGTGIIGKRIYNNLRYMNITPSYFIDNNTEKQGMYIDSVLICSPDKLRNDKAALVLIACSDRDMSVYRQAVEMGIAVENIYSVFKTNAFIARLAIERNIFDITRCRIKEKSVGIDLQNGAALGGVETWSLGQAEKLYASGYSVGVLLGNNNAQIAVNDVFDRKYMYNSKDIIEDMRNNLSILIDEGYSTVVSNFSGVDMFANCYYKKLNNDIRHIMVIHSDDDAYYESVIELKQYIDKCIVVSSRIEHKLYEKGFDKTKIVRLTWKMDNVTYKDIFMPESILRIGYAGRVTTVAKHLEYLPDIIKYLEDENINYIFEIAGIGDYYDQLSEFIEQNKLSSKVRLLGMLDKKAMQNFWNRQDIYFSCSDFEGHSISQCEGIAAGAVPVVTDVSGACDDIENGITGYIVPVGDWRMLAEKICYLSHHKDILEKMSLAGTEKMIQRNSVCKENILEELCH